MQDAAARRTADIVHHGHHPAAADVLLIDTDRIDIAHVGVGVRGIDQCAQRPPQTFIVHPEQITDPTHRHARHARQCHHHGLEHQREAAARPRPRHRNLLHLGLTAFAADATAHARQLGVDQRAVLEEMQMLPIALLPIMDRLIRRRTTRTGQPRSLAHHIEVDFVRLPVKPHRLHPPRLRHPQSRREQLRHRVRHRSSTTENAHRTACRYPTSRLLSTTRNKADPILPAYVDLHAVENSHAKIIFLVAVPVSTSRQEAMLNDLGINH